MLKHKFHAALNMLGLSIGIAFTLLIAAYAWGELQVNRSVRNIENQYIIQSNWKDPDMGLALTTVGPLAKALKEDYPNLVANYYRWDGITTNVSSGDKIFREGLQIGDSSFLHMYGFQLSYGDIRTALTEPFSVVITEDRAVKYFGKKDVLGQSLTLESFSGSRHDFKITGVMKNPAYNSINRITFDNDNQLYVPVNSAAYFSRSLDQWNNPYIVGFVELQNGVKPKDLEAPMQQIIAQRSIPEISANMRPYLVPLKDYYLQQNNGLVKKMIYTVSCIALFILLMAIINFINIAVGKSSTRIKEIGLRKVMGGARKQIIFQFLTESVLLVCFSTVLALLIYSLSAPYLSAVLGKAIPSLTAFPLYYVLVPVVLIFIIGLLTGIYPAFILSALSAVDSVKGKLQSVNANIYLRKTLVGFQFFTASVVLIGAMILGKQVSLFFSKDLGYNKDYVVSVQLPRDWTPAGVQKMETIRDEFSAMPEVSSASLTWSVPDGTGSGTTSLYAPGKDASQSILFESVIADKKYLETFQVPLTAGRTFRQASDSLNIVINESAVQSLGLKSAADAIGQRLYASPVESFTVIGVFSDFHFGSMKDKIRPMILTNVNFNNAYRLMCFKLKAGNMGAAMEKIQSKWSALLPGTSFDYKFMDESLQQLYRTELQLKKASQVATALALFIVVLGITGLISLSIRKRTKEIGIRKLLGASVSNIASLFMKDFLPVVLVSGIISIPVSWYIMQKWLNDYNYRVPVTAWPFTFSIMGLGALAILIIVIQIFKATLQNPVKSLRTE